MNQRYTRLGTLLISGLLAACATTPPEPEFPAFKAIAVSAEVEYQGGGEAQTAGARAVKGAAVGVAGGAAYGAVVGALACGPFFFACVPVMAGIGAATVGVAGAVGASMVAVGEEEAEALNELMTDLSSRKDLNRVLMNKLTEAIPNAAGPNQYADAHAFVRIDSILFTKNGEDLIQASIYARLLVNWGEAEAQMTEWTAENAAQGRIGESRALRYLQSTDAKSMDHWMADDGHSLTQSLERALHKISSEMAIDLGQPE